MSRHRTVRREISKGTYEDEEDYDDDVDNYDDSNFNDGNTFTP